MQIGKSHFNINKTNPLAMYSWAVSTEDIVDLILHSLIAIVVVAIAIHARN